MSHSEALEIVKQTVELCPALCDHLEKADAYFQVLLLLVSLRISFALILWPFHTLPGIQPDKLL